MRVEAEIVIARSRDEVFGYLARSEHLPEYATEFVQVEQISEGEPGLGTEYRYEMARGAKGTFKRTEFEPHSKLALRDPPAKAGPGSMDPLAGGICPRRVPVRG